MKVLILLMISLGKFLFSEFMITQWNLFVCHKILEFILKFKIKGW
jgi:hypothetical protein